MILDELRKLFKKPTHTQYLEALAFQVEVPETVYIHEIPYGTTLTQALSDYKREHLPDTELAQRIEGIEVDSMKSYEFDHQGSAFVFHPDYEPFFRDDIDLSIRSHRRRFTEMIQRITGHAAAETMALQHLGKMESLQRVMDNSKFDIDLGDFNETEQQYIGGFYASFNFYPDFSKGYLPFDPFSRRIFLTVIGSYQGRIRPQ